MQRFNFIYALSSVFLLCMLWPLGVAVANALAFAAWSALQLVSFLSARDAISDTDASHATARRVRATVDCSERQFVSVHLPIHNEPPDVVRGTLNALAQLQYPDVEVIVIDNNTELSSLWQPVERHCRSLGNRFRFVHRMDVDGAKAGALEIARGIMDPRTTHIAVVDADYQVSPDFLNVALDALEQSGAYYAQFPQSYRDVADEQKYVEAELADYFDRHAIASDRHGHMMLTGTLSVIDARALAAAGGWPTQTITEDAELAISLRRLGFHGVYVPRVAGRGLLPPNLHELQSQRHRWIVGNLQTLVRALQQSVQDGRLYMSSAHWAQLSAWCSFVTLPIILLMAGVFLSITGVVDTTQWRHISLIASATILGQLLVTILVSRGSPGFVLVRWTIALSSGWATLCGLAMQQMRFRCTKRQCSAGTRVSIKQILMPVLLVTGAVCAIQLSWFMAATALLLCTFSSAATYSLDRMLRSSSTSERLVQQQGVSSSHGK